MYPPSVITSAIHSGWPCCCWLIPTGANACCRCGLSSWTMSVAEPAVGGSATRPTVSVDATLVGSGAGRLPAAGWNPAT